MKTMKVAAAMKEMKAKKAMKMIHDSEKKTIKAAAAMKEKKTIKTTRSSKRPDRGSRCGEWLRAGQKHYTGGVQGWMAGWVGGGVCFIVPGWAGGGKEGGAGRDCIA